MDIFITFLSVALLLAAIAPVLMAGGACIAAFMLQKDIFKHLLLTLSTIGSLLLCALLVTGPIASQAMVLKALLFAAPVWADYWLFKKLLFKPV
jgi:hypothetical protein